jgi:hypothetical protein
MITGTYRHIVWPLVEAAIEMGWVPICPENEFSCLMRACDCNPEGRLPFETRRLPNEYQDRNCS